MMNKIKLLFTVIALLGVLISCEEDEDFIVESKSLALKIENTTGSGVKLIWNQPRMNNLVKYVLIRTEEEKDIDYYKNIISYYTTDYYGYWPYNDVIAHVYPGEVTEYTDQTGLNPTYYYKVFAYNNKGEYVLSNTITYNQDGYTKLDFVPSNAYMCQDENKIVFVSSDQKKLYVFDCDKNEIVKEKSFSFYVNYLCIGNNGFGNEIYVPGSDGTFSILDFELNEKYSTDLGGSLLSIVTDNNGYIFVQKTESYNTTIYPIKRSSNTIVEIFTSPNYYGYGRLAYFPGQNKIAELDGSRVYLYTYNSNGNLTYNNNYLYRSGDNNILEIFPDGSNIIFDDNGYVVSNSMDSYAELYDYSYEYYYDFAISSENIYASDVYEKRIDKFNYYYSKVSSYNSVLYPRFMCLGNSELIIIGSEQDYSNSDYYIERVNLSDF